MNNRKLMIKTKPYVICEEFGQLRSYMVELDMMRHIQNESGTVKVPDV